MTVNGRFENKKPQSYDGKLSKHWVLGNLLTQKTVGTSTNIACLA